MDQPEQNVWETSILHNRKKGEVLEIWRLLLLNNGIMLMMIYTDSTLSLIFLKLEEASH